MAKSYELGATERCMNPNTVDERGFIADIQQRHGLITTKPSTHTHTHGAMGVGLSLKLPSLWFLHQQSIFFLM